jgi:hypothetical protein
VTIKTTCFNFADEQDEEAVTTGGKVKVYLGLK